MSGRTGLEVAIIGLAGRFPGARSVEELWRNLREGVESISFFTPEELAAAGVPAEQISDPHYVPATGEVEGVDLFDAGFFELTPREAELLDPQHRLLLECAWEALERAGYAATRRPVGVFAGCSLNRYLLYNLIRNPGLLESAGAYALTLASDKDFLSTRLSYELNLEGPSMTVQTACSTSLVAVHSACQSLLAGECELALAGGVSVRMPRRTGYLYQAGSIASPDGHCRAFDAGARGTVNGEGVGVVVLKLLEDALADGDTVHAVIRGSAINNDGSLKAGFTAPRRDGQAGAIRAALRRAEADAGSIGYVEAHGTGTPLGDPIEIAALTQAFREDTDGRGFCAVGSIKTNIGHLDAAAGIAGLIKAVLALEHREIPPSLHFAAPNPEIDFAASPFRVAARLSPWEKGAAGGGPRRAGVSAFGIGGTNAHVVLEEAPEPAPSGPSRRHQLLLLSARTAGALEQATDGLAAFLAGGPEAGLADVAWTLQAGRKPFEHRRALVCSSAEDAAAALASRAPERLLTRHQEPLRRPVAFLFPGQGAQYADMGRGLYAEEEVFRRELDACAERLRPRLGRDLRGLLFPPEDGREEAERALRQTRWAQPALFAVEYALARLWISWGVTPWAMIGHSLGEYVAACLAGVFPLDDALDLVAARGELVQALPPGAMLSVDLPEEELAPLLGAGLALAAVNGPALCVAAGAEEEIADLEARLAESGVTSRRLHTSHAFHSAMMDPALSAFRQRVARVELRPPALPWVSNLTGTWITAEEATDPGYWARHLRQAVRFGDGIARLLAEPDVALLEVGPGKTLGSLARRSAAHAGRPGGPIVASMRHPRDAEDDSAVLLRALGRLWLAGVEVDWEGFRGGEDRRRVQLPTYPFQRQRYWLDFAGPTAEETSAAPVTPIAKPLSGHARPELETPYQEPRDETERRVAEIWSELLGIRALGVHDDFFELGGHSLLGTQVIARLRLATGVELPVSAMFESPTVAGLAARLGEMAGVAAGPESRRVRPSLRRRPEGSAEPPLSFAQQRLWFLDQLAPGSPAYNLGSVFRLRGPLDPAALAAALREVVRRHEALRTSLPSVNGVPVQRVAAAGASELPVEDLAPLPEAARLEEVRRRAGEETRQPFDLERGPLLRTRLLRLAEADHVLLLVMHHIISDGWSIRVLLSELVEIYTAFSAGRPSPLPELPVQYADYALWQREWLEGGALAAQLAWWRERLAGAPPVLDLPTDRPHTAGPAHRGASVHLVLPADLADAAARRAHEASASLFMLLLATFQVLLQRASHQDDLVTGTPIAGRTSPELEVLIGFFINTLALRADLSGDPPFREFLARVRGTTLGAYDHQDVPFDRLVDELQPERVLGRNPVFQVLFQLHNQPVEVGDPQGLAAEPLAFDTGSVRFDLALSLTETGDRILGILEYDSDLFDRATAEALAGRFRRLVEGVVADPGRRLSELPLLSAEDVRQILAAGDETGVIAVAGSVPGWIAEQARLQPGALAVVCEEESLTYGELDRRAGRLAARLRRLGVGPETPVALLAERSAAMIAALLGIWRAGGAYLALDPDLPAERLAWMLEDSRAAALVTQRDLADRLPSSLPAVLFEDEIEGGSVAAPILPEALAYVIYTSGSTGRAKGVMVEHRQLAAYVRGVLERLAPLPGTSWATVSTIAADLGNTSIFAALCTGGTLHVIARDRLADPEGMAEYLGRHGVDGLKIVPSHLAALLGASRPERVLPRRLLVLGGEASPWELVDRVRRLAPDLRVVNHYGPTETTVGVLTLELEDGEERRAAAVPLGGPVPGSRIVLLDPHGGLVPRGVPGELYVAGAGVSRGYLGRPDLTAERFVPDPFTASPGERMYRTGDLVRHLPDGRRLEFLGRADHQVKLRGFRIELGEVEAALRACPGVREAAVLVHGEGTDRHLVAYVAADVAADGPPAAAELRDVLRQRLAEVMVPAVFIAVEALPLTANGKLDRRALARLEPPAEAPAVAGTWSTPVEEIVAGVWAEVLGVPAVGPRDRFFDLGGHSLLATQVISRLREAFGVGVPLRALFDEPTVAGLAAAVEAAMRDGGEPVAPRVERAPREDDLPLSFNQLRLWFLHRLEPESQAYNLRYVLRLSGPLDREVLARSLAEVVARHEALRTTFLLKDRAAEPVQVIQPAGPVPLPLADLTALSSLEAREQEARRLAALEARRPFELERGPMLRALLMRFGEDDHALAFVVHHIASDGWSRGVLVRELAALYPAFAEERPSPLPALPIQYADYAVWQRRWLQGEALASRLRWWRERLAGAPPSLDLPADRPRPLPGRGTGRAGQVSDVFPEDLVRALAALGRRHGATLFMVLAAAWKTLLHRHAGETDLSVGTPIANRNRAEIEPLIGFFVNTLVLRTDLAGRPAFRELIGRVRETTLGAYAHQDLPFEKLVEHLAPERDLTHTPLFQVMFILHNAAAGGPRLPGLTFSIFDLPERAAIVDLALAMEEIEDGLVASVEFSRDRFDETTAARLLGRLRVLVAGIALAPEAPERRLGDLPLLTEEERHQLLREWQGAPQPPPGQPGLHHLFIAQAERTPRDVALIDGDLCLTYHELAARASRLARHLRSLGVGPEVRVGICLERSHVLVEALLGTLMAGGAYVPLDPAYPEDRLAFQVADSGAPVLLTQASLRHRLAALAPGARTLALDDLDELVESLAAAGDEPPDEPAEAATDPRCLAYVIYTSGSTGRPKGVGIEHRSATALVRWAGEVFADDELAGVLAATSVCFDLSVFELFVPLSRGGAVVLAANVLALPGLPAAGEVTLVNTVPSAIAELARAGKIPPSVRTVNLAGEPLPGSLVREVYARSRAERVWNLYGPSEDTTYSTFALCGRGDRREPSIGRPVAGTRALVLDAELRPLPVGAAGELCLAGEGLARGYLGRPALTAERFVPDPFGGPGERLYRTGDLARRRADGELEFLGRIDLQVKVRGFRIELGEVESTLRAHPGVREAAVLARGKGADRRLVAYVAPPGIPPAELRAFLRARLPEPMVPGIWVALAALPLSPNGKVDRRALGRIEPEAPAVRREERAQGAPRGPAERAVAAVWREVLGLTEAEEVGRHQSFFDLGGHSLLLVRVQGRLAEELGREVSLVDLFRYPTVSALAGFLAPDAEAPAAAPRRQRRGPVSTEDRRVAVIGMAGRFPGSGDVEAFWRNLCAGVESVSRHTDAELAAAGVDPTLRANPHFVPAGGVLEGIELFDAGFFGYTPRDAEIADPQQRLFLEQAWAALESAGYVPETCPGPVGVFAGVSRSDYLWNLFSNPEIVQTVGAYKIGIATEKDHLATTVSYKLDLKGPSLSVQTACSTSLVAVHIACRSLLAGECDMALAGGASITVPQGAGYLYQEGGIRSPDGHCRAFDARAQGTVGGSGVGAVVLKRLADALADGDPVHAVILGSAINNDGSGKVGYTAPSVEGQAEVIQTALEAGGVDPRTVGYVEAHGTGTPLGDPIEVAALTQAFRTGTADRGFCALGSVKTNLGHLDAAAGVAGLIKTALALEHGKLPPSLHFETPNPKIDFAASPFFVADRLAEWQSEGPRRAGVSSFGIGGTNAHAVLEEPPPAAPGAPPRHPWQLLVLSARTPSALDAAAAGLRRFLEERPETGLTGLADAAWTLQTGRRAFGHRRAVLCGDVAGAVAALGRPGGERAEEGRGVVFLFPGQGAQYPGMGLGLYRSEPVFREEMDRAAEVLRPWLGLDLRDLLEEELEDTALAQPALFAVEHALARLWMSWGVLPEAMLGHSLGEYVAACLAGVFSFEDGLSLVAQRGRLLGGLARGCMASVPLPEDGVSPLLAGGLALAAVNGPAQCVVSGPEAEVRGLLERLAGRGIEGRRLHTSHAFHSAMMEPAVTPFAAAAGRIRLSPPRIPWVSNVTGTWITEAEATDPGYWARHLRATVRFADGLATLLRPPADRPAPALLEVGPGRALSALARRHPDRAPACPVVPSLRHPNDARDDAETVLAALGQLWTAGVPVDWRAFHDGVRRRRVTLPTYPFERRRYWIEPGRDETPARREPADRFWAPFWKPAPSVPTGGDARGPWLVFLPAAEEAGEDGFGEALLDQLRRLGAETVAVRLDGGLRRREDYDALLSGIARERGSVPPRILHLGSAGPQEPANSLAERLARLEREKERGFYSLLFLLQALGDRGGAESFEVHVVTSGAQKVAAGDLPCAERAMTLALCRVAPREYPGLTCRALDIGFPVRERWLGRIAAEIAAPASAPLSAWRGGERWLPDLAPVRLAERSTPAEGEVWLVTGGLGGLGLAIAEHLAAARARLVLLGRQGLPPEEEWDLAPRGMAGAELAPREIELRRQLGVRGIASRSGAQESLDAFCSARLLRFLIESGVEVRRGARHRREELRQALRLLPKFHHFLDFLLATLAEDGWLRLEGGTAVFQVDAAGAPDPAALAREAAACHPALRPILERVERCAAGYGPALSGDDEALKFLFSAGDEGEPVESLSHEPVYTALAAEIAVRAAGRCAAEGRVLRVLEAGGGQGVLTQRVAPALAGRGAEYWFTDLGRLFVTEAEREAARAGLDFLRFGLLDISRDPVEQGYGPESFDLLFALNVVHATPDVEATLRHLRRLLRPGGELCLIELTRRQRWMDMVWGLAEGWWLFSDSYRHGSPLLGLEAWKEALARAGFEVAAALPEDGDGRADADCGLLLATRPAVAGVAGVAAAVDTAGRIGRVRRMRAMGAEVAVETADAADPEALRAAARRAVERFGRLDGVIHAAGVPGGGLLALQTREALEEELAAKVRGALALGELCRELSPGKLVLFSSTSALTGQLGQGGYCAANAYLDAWAHLHAAETGTPTVAIDWDRWQGIGMAAAVERRHRELTGEELTGGISPAEGAEAFDRALASGLAQVVVSPEDFAARWARAQQAGANVTETFVRRPAPVSVHERPPLATAYVPPSDELEREITEIWQEVFGIERIGIHDDFFELGGDSLVALQLVSRLGKALGAELRVRSLFDAPTVAALAVAVEEAMLAGASQEELELALDEGALP